MKQINWSDEAAIKELFYHPFVQKSGPTVFSTATPTPADLFLAVLGEPALDLYIRYTNERLDACRQKALAKEAAKRYSRPRTRPSDSLYPLEKGEFYTFLGCLLHIKLSAHRSPESHFR